MTGLATSRKHASTRCVRILPGPIHRPGRSLLIRATPAPVSAATVSRPRHPLRHPSISMRSDEEAPEHGDWFASQASNPKVLEAVGRHFGVPHRSPAAVGAHLAEAFNQIGIYAGKSIE